MSHREYRQLTLSRDQDDTEHDHFGVVAVERVDPELRKPRMYRVLMLNDDYTPMEFVVDVLEMIFMMSREQATRTMLQVHTEGQASCGVYTRDIAETKTEQTNQYARECEHPLLCRIEPVEFGED